MVWVVFSMGLLAQAQPNCTAPGFAQFDFWPGRVKQTWENSTDGGKTWTMTFDAICVRLK